MTEVLMLYRPGADRDVISSFLSKSGHDVHPESDLSALREALLLPPAGEAGRVAVIQVSSVPSRADCTFLEACPSLALGPHHVAPEGASRERLDDPCFLDDLASAVSRLCEGRPAPVTPGVRPRPPQPPREARSLLLRGVAHALTNPLSAALGWLQLLRSSGEHRYVEKLGRELRRIEQITHAISLLGRGSSGVEVPIDLFQLLADGVQKLADEGLPVRLVPAGKHIPTVPGDPVEWSLLCELLLSSFHEDRARLETLQIGLAAGDHALVLDVLSEGVRVPRDLDPSRLDELLFRKIRHTRALALGLAQLLVVETRGGTLSFHKQGPEASLVRMHIPVPDAQEPLDP